MLAVPSPYDETLDPADLALFQQTYNLPPTKLLLNDTNGGSCLGGNGDDPEPALDVCMAFATVPDAAKYGGVQYLCPKVASHDFCGALLDYVLWLSNQTAPSRVHTFSYGVGIGRCKTAIRTRMDAELQKLGARGISLLFASGDEGSAIWKGGQMYPAASPFATAVGGTVLQADLKTEHGWRSSGGGFEPAYARPTWQNRSVAAYLAAVSTSKATAGRAYPDVAAFATHVCSVGGGALTCSSTGTSAATPIAAAAFGLVNAARAQRGQPTLGFANPWLYALAGRGAFNSVSVGSNGYPAAEGYDVVTGLGSLNVGALLKLDAEMWRERQQLHV